MTAFMCPCCGYAGLSAPAYAHVSFPVPTSLSPPYAQHFGTPSYDVCDCCGFEFGNDDEPGTSDAVTFQSYLREWIDEGATWADPSKRPQDWSLHDQLTRAGLRAT